MIAYTQEQSCYDDAISIFAMAPGMDGLESDRKLVQDLVAWSGKSVAKIASIAGMANTTLNRHFNGTAESRLSQPTIDKLKAAFLDFPGWGYDNEDETSRLDYVDVDVLPSYGGMGGGGSGEGDRIIAKLSRTLVEDELKGRAGDFLLIDVRGDSMKPDFWHGDQILVDKRDRDPVQPGPFAIWDGDAYVVKLVERVPGRRGWYRIFSANDRYSPYEVPEDEAQIMGRTVWFARRL